MDHDQENSGVSSNVTPITNRRESPIPFEVPEHVRQELDQRGRWKWWVKRFGNPGGSETAGHYALSLLHEQLEYEAAILAELADVMGEVDPRSDGGKLLGISTAIARTIADMEDLLYFEWATLPYDPSGKQQIDRALGKIRAGGGES